MSLQSLLVIIFSIYSIQISGQIKEYLLAMSKFTCILKSFSTVFQLYNDSRRMTYMQRVLVFEILCAVVQYRHEMNSTFNRLV